MFENWISGEVTVGYADLEVLVSHSGGDIGTAVLFMWWSSAEESSGLEMNIQE